MYVLEWRTVSALMKGLFWCLFPELRSNDGNKYQITPEWAQKQFVTRVHTLFYFLHDITSINDDKTTIVTHRPRVSLARFSFCWWRHNRLLLTSQWPDNCDAITWVLISSSLDIDFIHGDIHSRSCKKLYHLDWLHYQGFGSWAANMQGSFWAWAYPSIDDVTLYHSMLLAEPIPRMVSDMLQHV